MKQTLPLLAALLLATVAALNGADSPSGKPNVIIVLTDDQGYGDLSCTGNPVLKTPHMDRLAAEGVNFANFHVDSYCTPTRSALLHNGRWESKPRPGFECDVFFVVMGTPRNETGPNPPSPKYGHGCAVMTDRWRWVNDRGLYDLTNDPRQEREITGLHPEVTTESRKALCSGFYVSVQNSKET